MLAVSSERSPACQRATRNADHVSGAFILSKPVLNGALHGLALYLELSLLQEVVHTFEEAALSQVKTAIFTTFSGPSNFRTYDMGMNLTSAVQPRDLSECRRTHQSMDV